MVGLLAAVGAAMSAVAGLTHGDLFWAVIVDAAVATGLAAYLALPPTKKRPLPLLLVDADAVQLALVLSSKEARAQKTQSLKHRGLPKKEARPPDRRGILPGKISVQCGA